MSAASTPLRDIDDAPPRDHARPQGMALPFDLVLLLAVAGLAACSLVAIRSSTADDIAGDPTYYFKRQAIFFAVGGVLSLALIRFDYARLRAARWWIYGFLMASIFAVAPDRLHRQGRAALDPARPVPVPGLRAGQGADRRRRSPASPPTARGACRSATPPPGPCSSALIPAAFVMVQPDLGSSLVYGAISLAILYFAGTPARHFLALFALGAVAISLVLVAAPAAGVPVLHGYQKDRLTSFLHPSSDTNRAGYQQNQSLIADRLRSEDRARRSRDADEVQLPARAPHRLHQCRRR